MTRTWRFWTLHDARVILIGLGILLSSTGGVVLLNDISPRQYPAIVLWLVFVLIGHDVVISALVFAVAFAGRRARRRVSARSILIAQSALAVAAIMVLLVVPEIVKKMIGTANPSILPLDYVSHLAVLVVSLTVVAIVAIGVHVLLDRQRRKT